MLIHFMILIGLAVYDVISTRIVLYVGGVEINPIMDGVIQTTWGIGLKLGITLLVALYLLYRRSKVGFIVANGIMLAVAIINTISIIIQYNL